MNDGVLMMIGNDVNNDDVLMFFVNMTVNKYQFLWLLIVCILFYTFSIRLMIYLFLLFYLRLSL